MVLRLTLRVLAAAVLFTAHTVQVYAYLTPGESFGIEAQTEGGSTEVIPPLPTIIEQPTPTPAASTQSTPAMTLSPGVRPQAVRRGGRIFTSESEEAEEEMAAAAQERLHSAAEERREQRAQNVRPVAQYIAPSPTPQAHSAARALPPTGFPLASVFEISLLCSAALYTYKKSKQSTSSPSFPWTI